MILYFNVLLLFFRLRSVTDHELMKNCEESEDLSCIAGVGAVKSAFYCQTTPAVKDFLDEDLAPLLVFLQYLTQLEVISNYYLINC